MTKKRFFLIHMLILCAWSQSYGQMPDSVKAHIDSSLAILQEHSLYADGVNWETLRAKVHKEAESATTKAATFQALKIAFDALGDLHAAYFQYDEQYRIENKALLARYSDSIKVAWSKGPRILHQQIDSVAYISIPFMKANKQEDIDRYANRIYETVTRLHQQNPKAWIIDLRLNGGGNIRPMLAGLAPFFKEGIVAYYVDREGNASDELAFKNGDFTIDGVVQAGVKNKIPGFEPVKVAVLIGPGTASSGEGVAVVFQQRAMTRLFGSPSAGLANATNGFVFNEENSYFLISTAYIGNRHKEALPESVAPDVMVKENDAFSDPNNDTVVKAAVDWLMPAE